jgi:hypothetical protein
MDSNSFLRRSYLSVLNRLFRDRTLQSVLFAYFKLFHVNPHNWMFTSSGILRRVIRMWTDVSEKVSLPSSGRKTSQTRNQLVTKFWLANRYHAGSLLGLLFALKMEVIISFVPQFTCRLHSAISEKMATLITIAVRTSNIKSFMIFFRYHLAQSSLSRINIYVLNRATAINVV